MKTTATNKKLRELLRAIDSGVLIPQPDFQRRLVWRNDEKLSFIRTVVDGYPFPEIYIAAGDVDPDTGEAREYLVDGQQRITTLYDFWKNSLEIKLDNIIPFSEMEPDKKKEFLQYEVVVRDLGDLSLDEIKDIFQRINATSYSLNAMEIDNARYDGCFKKFGEKVASLEFFEEIRFFNGSDYKRMNDIRYCLMLIITMMSSYFDQDKELSTYLEQYNETFSEEKELMLRIENVLSLIKNCSFAKKSRVWNKADFFTVIVETDRILREEKVTKKTLKENLISFYKFLDDCENPEELRGDNAEYYKAALQGSNSRSRRVQRGKILYNHLIAGDIT